MINPAALFVFKECASSNPKVKNSALELIGQMHSQLGPVVKALIVSKNDIQQPVMDQIESKMNACPMDPNAASIVREKTCLVLDKSSSGDGANESDVNAFEITKTDIVAALPSDCIDKMVRSKSYEYESQRTWFISCCFTNRNTLENAETGIQGSQRLLEEEEGST